MHLEIFCDALFVRATNVSAANGYTPSQASALPAAKSLFRFANLDHHAGNRNGLRND